MLKKISLTIILLGAILSIIAILIQRQRRHTTTLTSTVLKPTEKEKVILDVMKGKVTMVKRDGTKQVVSNSVGVRKAALTLHDDGSLSLDAPQRGFVLEPGIGLQYSDCNRLGLDVQFYYWKRIGALAGVSWPLVRNRNPRAYIGLSCDIWSNTSGYVGIDTKKDLVVGVRVQF